MLPQRRNRVYGLAFAMAGSSVPQVQETYSQCLEALKTNFQFPSNLMFENKPREKPTKSHQETITGVQKKCPSSRDLYVDCASSSSRLTYGDKVLPCLTPSHSIFSTRLERYLSKCDLLNCQGLWASTFNPEAYKILLEGDAQDVAGNAFSATVFQATFLAAFACAPDTWDSVSISASVESTPGDQLAPILRRLKRKQPAPSDFVVSAPAKKKKSKNAGKYARKTPGFDSRKLAKGKRPCATLWEKEQVSGPPVSLHTCRCIYLCSWLSQECDENTERQRERKRERACFLHMGHYGACFLEAPTNVGPEKRLEWCILTLPFSSLLWGWKPTIEPNLTPTSAIHANMSRDCNWEASLGAAYFAGRDLANKIAGLYFARHARL